MFEVLVLFYIIIGIIELFEVKVPKKVICFIAVLPAFALTAFRDVSVGCDTGVYLRTFDVIGSVNDFSRIVNASRMENGYLLLNYLFSHLGFSFFHMQFFISMFFYSALSFFLIKYSKNIGISCLIFLSLRYMFGPMNVVRMYVAIGFLFFAIPFIQSRKILFFSVFVILAACFQKTALLFFIMYPLCRVDFSKKMIVLFLSGATFAGLIGKAFFAKITDLINVYERYIDSRYFDVEGNIAIYITLAIDVMMALFLLYSNYQLGETKRLLKQEQGVISIEKISKTALILVLSFDLLGLGNAIMSRISGYFTFCWLFLISLAVMQLKNKVSAIAFLLVFSVCLFAQFEVVLIYRPNWNCVEPYRFFWGSFF